MERTNEEYMKFRNVILELDLISDELSLLQNKSTIQIKRRILFLV